MEKTPGTPTIELIDLQAQRQLLGAGLDAAIKRVLEHGHFIMGPEVGLLEERLAAFCGCRHAIACANGTDALVLGLMAKGIGKGDAVLVPSFTFAATAEVVALRGAVPVFVDVDPDSFNMDPDSLEKGIAAARAAGLKPRAVIAVDLFGQPADYDRIEQIAAAHDLWVLADSAQSFGATYCGRRAGRFGLISATSFFPAKPLGCYGDGGAVFTDDDRLADAMRSLRIHGKGTDKYDNVRIGLNSRLDTLQAAILLEKLKLFDAEIDKRQAVADRYGAGLEGLAGTGLVRVPRPIAGARSVWAQYTLVFMRHDRAAVAAALKRQGVPTAVYYPRPLHRQAAYDSFPVAGSGLPVSDGLAGQVLSLPIHPYLDAPAQDRVIEAVCGALR